MESRDERILAHVALYRITFQRILARLFFNSRETACANVLDRLRKQRRLHAIALRGGPLKCYQLTPEEAARRGLPHRGIALGSRALPEAIAILWFCTVSGVPRHRLERDELERLYGRDAPHGPHCVEESPTPRVYRIYVPGPRTKMAAILSTVTTLAEEAKHHASLAPWMANQLYGFAVLLSTEARESRLRRAVTANDTMKHVHFQITRIPDTHTLQEALYALRA